MILGIGVDLVEIIRIRRALENHGERFIRKVYTTAEQEFCRARRDPMPHFAARFAAKEAVFKALGTGWGKGVAWTDVEVRRREPDPPSLRLSGGAAKHSLSLGPIHIHLSLSHSEHWAVAVVVLEEEPGPVGD